MNQKSTAEVHLDRWGKSGLTQVEYCKKNGVNPGTFAYWKNKHGKKKLLVKEDNSFIEISPEVFDAGETMIEIRIDPEGEIRVYLRPRRNFR